MLNRKQQSPGPHMTRDSVVQDNAKPKSTKFNTMHIQRKCSPGLRGPKTTMFNTMHIQSQCILGLRGPKTTKFNTMHICTETM